MSGFVVYLGAGQAGLSSAVSPSFRHKSSSAFISEKEQPSSPTTMHSCAECAREAVTQSRSDPYT